MFAGNLHRVSYPECAKSGRTLAQSLGPNRPRRQGDEDPIISRGSFNGDINSTSISLNPARMARYRILVERSQGFLPGGNFRNIHSATGQSRRACILIHPSPYKHNTSDPPLRLASSEPTPSSPDPPLCHLTSCFTGSGLQ